jgi:hypothetical protein
MGITELFQALKSRPAQPPVSKWLPDPTPTGAAEAPFGYFQIRLTDMFLVDGRRWLSEVTPTTFLMAEYNYKDGYVSQPYFVSDKLVKGLEQAKAGACRVRFADKAIFGPIPYIGGEVSLFVGLFQSTISDHRKALFSVFETLFGGLALGGLSHYLKLADQLTAQISSCLGGGDVECLLAEQRSIGHNAFPPGGYLVYLRSPEGKANTEGLVMQDGYLHRQVGNGLQLVDDHDFCVIQVERLEQRNDYMTMPFHRTWEAARKKMLVNQEQEAQGLMLECTYQILDSPDLTEDNKASLIEFYQARLMASRTMLAGPGQGSGPVRAGGPDEIRQMQGRALHSRRRDAEELAGHFEHIARLTSKLEDEPDEENSIAGQLQDYLRKRYAQTGHPPAAELARALAIGTLATGRQS